MEYDVFISFSKKDKKLAKKFYNKLKVKGKSPFFFVESQNQGDNYEQRINDALHSCRDFLLICTVNSAASRQVRKECETFNILYKKALETENERRIFIFEGPNFEDDYVPDIEDWDKIQRCDNFDKQLEAILETKKEKNKFLRWLIVGLIIAVVSGIIMFNRLYDENHKTMAEPQTQSKRVDTVFVISAVPPVAQDSTLYKKYMENGDFLFKQKKYTKAKKEYENANSKISTKEAKNKISQCKEILNKRFEIYLEQKEVFSNYYIVKNNNKVWGLIDEDANIIIKPFYDDCKVSGNDIVFTKGEETKYYYFDKNMKIIKERIEP